MSARTHRQHPRPRRRGLAGLTALSAAVLAAALVQPPAVAELAAGQAEQTPGESYAAMGYGVFMHYGLATYVGKSPWSYDPYQVPATEFEPTDFDPDQWMGAVQASGAEYIVLTAKHHDGFTMWPSDYNDYGVETSSVPNIDVVGDVVSAARARGLKVVLYYSWYDKHEPGGDIAVNGDRTTDSPAYLAYAKNQITELLTEYGHIEGLWLDIAPQDDVQLPELAAHVHAVSPTTAFVPNFPSAMFPTDAPDVRTFEGPTEMMPCDYGDPRPAEQAFNVSAGPGWWQASDTAGPTRTIGDVAALRSWVDQSGATLSLNVSPGPSGRLPNASVSWLTTLGTVEFDAGAPYLELADGRRVYDDGRAWCGQQGGIRYGGAWTAGHWNGAYEDTRHYSRSVGAEAHLSFAGTAVQVKVQTRPGHGIAAISLDGGTPERVDTYSATPHEQVVKWERTGLPCGPHTVRIEVTGDKNPASSNRWVSLDSIVVTP